MKLHHIVIQNILIILFGVTVLYLDYIEFAGFDSRILLIAFSIIKSGYFVVTGFRKILAFSKTDLKYHHFLLFIGLSITLMVISFAADYVCLYVIDPDSFSGVAPGMSWIETSIRFWFFSVFIFANIGVVTIAPASLASEFLMMIEAVLSFVTIILVLSDFISLKESLMSRKARA